MAACSNLGQRINLKHFESARNSHSNTKPSKPTTEAKKDAFIFGLLSNKEVSYTKFSINVWTERGTLNNLNNISTMSKGCLQRLKTLCFIRPIAPSVFENPPEITTRQRNTMQEMENDTNTSMVLTCTNNLRKKGKRQPDALQHFVRQKDKTGAFRVRFQSFYWDSEQAASRGCCEHSASQVLHFAAAFLPYPSSHYLTLILSRIVGSLA